MNSARSLIDTLREALGNALEALAGRPRPALQPVPVPVRSRR